MTIFDPSEYTRAPVITVSGGVTLARVLVELRPEQATPAVDKAVRKLTEVADEAQDAMLQRRKAEVGGEENTRAVDADADGSWQALDARLAAYAHLPADDFADEMERAGKLRDMMFGPGGLAFLQKRYPVQLTLADNILKRIDKYKLQKEIDALAGPVFLKAVRMQHERYDKMVKGMLSRTRNDEDLRSHRRKLQQAIVDYAIKVCATVDDDFPETAEAARAALLPIANYRQANTYNRSASSQSDKNPPDEPPDESGPEGPA